MVTILAIETSLNNKQGFVPKAFYKDGIGDIDLAWGKVAKTGMGLLILSKMEKQDKTKFMKNICLKAMRQMA